MGHLSERPLTLSRPPVVLPVDIAIPPVGTTLRRAEQPVMPIFPTVTAYTLSAGRLETVGRGLVFIGEFHAAV